MEKRKPHYSLETVRKLIECGGWRFTHAARVGALTLGLDEVSALATVNNLVAASFYKSMTTHTDNRVWQDVYHTPLIDGRMAYIKLTVHDGLLIVSFKEK